ncbi:MAG: hypothetical protein IJV80_06210 [Clostridia bacterium]|nr:hypothetical protein [Clostridia bacterium]
MDEKTWKRLQNLQSELPYADPNRAAKIATEISRITLLEMLRVRGKRN